MKSTYMAARTFDQVEPHLAPGTVYLVGAGPGDPGLLTLRAVECLKKADLVLYDYLANPTLVEHAREGAELVRLGHHKGGRNLAPGEITAIMVDAALEGRSVVRLKGGDPSVFARGGDEAEALRHAGIPFEIVPGITSGLAVAAYAEIPLTHHDDASAVALVTGRERDGKNGSHLDYGVLADFPGTLVFYMGVTRAGDWSSALMEHGRSPETPVAVVRWCSRAWQQTVRCTLGTVAEIVATTGLRPPALFVVGEVVRRSPCLSWFQSRPLFGTTVLVAGTTRTAVRLRDRLAERGAEVLLQPVIRVVDPPNWGPVDNALRHLEAYDWIVFSSPNGVTFLLDRLMNCGGDGRWLAGVRIAALGSGTAERLAHYHLRPDLVPAQYHRELLARAVAGAAGARVLLPRVSLDRPALARELEAAGAEVDQLAVYSTVDVEDADPDVARALADGEVDVVAVTSSATARALARLYGDGLSRARIASLTPLTSDALRRSGHEPAVEASPPTVDGLVEAVTRIRHEAAVGAEADLALTASEVSGVT